MTRGRTIRIVLGMGLLCLAANIAIRRTPGQDSSTPIAAKIMPPVVGQMKSVGTPSCSARGCHGGIEPLEGRDQIQRNEYTTWLHNDPHAKARDVLTNEVSKQMEVRLDLKTRAFEHARCLACHAPPMLPLTEAVAHEERHFGVGCEACHGPAEKWLGPHTAGKNWPQKQESEMVDVGDTRSLAQQCVACHVGAKPGSDVNHDLIAAGHPRLNFEFSGYLANLPSHWRKEKPPLNTKQTPASVYATGQMVTAKAALELLAARAEAAQADPTKTPWPEFVEYDCFSCHHDLQSKSSRQESGAPRGLGTPMWGSWYLTIPRALVSQDDVTQKGISKALMDITNTMQGSSADKRIVASARLAAGQVGKWLETPALHEADSTKLRQLVVKAFRPDSQGVSRADFNVNWDAVAQIYLAIDALNQVEKSDRVKNGLEELEVLLRLPADASSNRYQSPKGKPFSIKSLEDALRPLAN